MGEVPLFIQTLPIIKIFWLLKVSVLIVLLSNNVWLRFILLSHINLSLLNILSNKDNINTLNTELLIQNLLNLIFVIILNIYLLWFFIWLFHLLYLLLRTLILLGSSVFLRFFEICFKVQSCSMRFEKRCSLIT